MYIQAKDHSCFSKNSTESPVTAVIRQERRVSRCTREIFVGKHVLAQTVLSVA